MIINCGGPLGDSLGDSLGAGLTIGGSGTNEVVGAEEKYMEVIVGQDVGYSEGQEVEGTDKVM